MTFEEIVHCTHRRQATPEPGALRLPHILRDLRERDIVPCLGVHILLNFLKNTSEFLSPLAKLVEAIDCL